MARRKADIGYALFLPLPNSGDKMDMKTKICELWENW